MSDILVLGLKAETVKRLKARAKRHGRSLQGEARLVLEQAGGTGAEEVGQMLEAWRRKFAGRTFAGSAGLIRQDRDR
jgi:plasmid stability protein